MPKKERKVSLQVDVFVKDDEIDEVKESAHLGNQVMTPVEGESGVYGCTGVYGRQNSKVPVTLTLNELGKVVPKVEIVAGMHEVTKDVEFDALSWLGETEKLEALTDDEKERLSSIGTEELHDIVVKSRDHEPPTTALEGAAIAIVQHSDVPESIVTWEHNTQVVVGDHTDGADVFLDVGENEFEVGDKYWAFCEYKVCNDERELYRYTWMGVPVSVLDEPTD
jgi:hypothetical protein